ncbi:G2/M phase-specific E3 ubiquitin-protein ligase-like [Brachyhypopomus gauderio]|uniref:G2/M phase-specific E3 ubiquitin-protein ligase-like n=1 Tax=Brachyhypopomus gauderio TaxID=698409 RepID=UPI0040430EA6
MCRTHQNRRHSSKRQCLHRLHSPTYSFAGSSTVADKGKTSLHFRKQIYKNTKNEFTSIETLLPATETLLPVGYRNKFTNGESDGKAEQPCPSYKHFMEYRNSKSKERQAFSCGPKRRSKQERRQVQINIGLMVPHGCDLKPVRGKTLPLLTDPEIEARDLLKQAVQKMRVFYKDMEEGPYVLLYPDCSEVVYVPGTERSFTLAGYKKEIGKTYCKITLFVCLQKHFGEVNVNSESNSDSEIVITTRSRAEFSEADTVVFKPQNQSTPNNRPEDEVEEVKITLPDIITNLSHPIDHGRVSRFNISRSNVWDGAVRGFKRATYSESCDMLVRFTDDAGVFEDGIDAGGPRREFLTLLTNNLKDRPIFDGPAGQRFLVYNANAVREDEYYMAGKMIAVSVVHGGPGPHFLSEELVLYLAGQSSFKGTVDLITDEGIGEALREIESAASVDALRESMLRHSTMLQTAGCLRHVNTLEEKGTIVSDYLRWYIIDRNSCVINRFKEGLSALQFLTALQLYPTLLVPVLCHSEKKLTALQLESLFQPDLSPSGSNRRIREGQTLGYWADYLLDCEEGQAAVCVDDVFMFATGLTSLPPAGLDPLPKIEFLDDSPFPMANTCSNTLKLPLLDSYNEFRTNMDFGIQNSPGFTCY